MSTLTSRRPVTRKTILLLHIAASVALLGEVWGLVVLNLSATLTDDPALAHSAYRLMERLVFAGGIPLSLIALVTGIVLALASRWGLMRYYWTFGKLVLLIAVILTGMFAFDPTGLAAAMESGAATQARQWVSVTAVSAQAAMLLSATAMSVYRPRWRTPWSTSRADKPAYR